MHSGISCGYDLEKPLPDGSVRTLQVRKTRYINQQGERFIVGVIRDITSQVALQQQQSRYAQYLSGAIEQERCRIARELHDHLGHALTEQAFKLRRLQRSLPQRQRKAAEHLDELLKGVDRMVRIVQRLCTGLRPSLLDELGLAAAVEWLAEETTRASGINCRVTWSTDSPTAPEQGIELFRIVQESLNNVMKHAAADQVTIEFGRTAESTILEISDNGCGFDPFSAEQRRTFGLIGMQERAAALGGTLQIISRSGIGTSVRLTMPTHKKDTP